MSSLAILIPIVVVTWLCGLTLIVALCVMSARSDRATRLALRRATADGRQLSSRRRRGGLAL